MIRPISLLRSNSETPEFSAPINNIKKDAIDCGITALPCCLPAWFQRFATAHVFAFCLALLGVCQGSAQAYFAASVGHVREVFDYSSTLVEWLLVSHDLFMGLFGVVVAYWGSRLHRAAWLGGLACLQGASCFLVIIPYIVHRGSDSSGVITSPAGPSLCRDDVLYSSTSLEILPEDHDRCWLTLSVLIVLQLFIGFANASFYSHGLSYIDDNVEENSAPYYIASILSVRMTSVQFGSFLAWSFLKDTKTWWIGYPVVGCLLILTGTLIATFPRSLVSTVLKQAAASILDIATGNSMQSIQVHETAYKKGFFASFKRIITNKIIIFNTLSSAFMYMALDNFSQYEAKYMESQFFIPMEGEGFHDPWTSRLITNILRNPLIALHIFIAGLIIARVRPSARKLAAWNVFSSLVVGCVILSYVFIDCNKGQIVQEYKGHLMNPYCSKQCNCNAYSPKFLPVCTQNGSQTYYSPCHAGCKSVIYINNIKMYSDCTCGYIIPHSAPVPIVATEGACDNAECAIHWKLFQSLTVLTAALIGTGYVGNVLINLRAVKPTDKAMSIAFDLCFSGILVHIPGKFIYKAIADNTCQYLSSDGLNCNLQNSSFGDILSIVTAILLLISVFMDCSVMYLVRNLPIFPEEDHEKNMTIEPGQELLSSSNRDSAVPPSPSQSTLEYRRPRRSQQRSDSSRSTWRENEPLYADDFRRDLAVEINRRSTRV